MKGLVVLVVVLALTLVGCTQSIPPPTVEVGGRNVAYVTVREGGLSVDNAVWEVSNLHSDSRAEVVYRVHNATPAAVKLGIYVNKDADIANYSGAGGAIRAPEEVLSWVETPPAVDVAPGEIRDFVVAVAMPERAKKPADKVGFQVSVVPETGGNLQRAVGTWWIVSMR